MSLNIAFLRKKKELRDVKSWEERSELWGKKVAITFFFFFVSETGFHKKTHQKKNIYFFFQVLVKCCIMHFTSLMYIKLYSSTFWSFLQRCLSLWIKASVKWLNANIWFTNLLYHHFPPKNCAFFLAVDGFLFYFMERYKLFKIM